MRVARWRLVCQSRIHPLWLRLWEMERKNPLESRQAMRRRPPRWLSAYSEHPSWGSRANGPLASMPACRSTQPLALARGGMIARDHDYIPASIMTNAAPHQSACGYIKRGLSGGESPRALMRGGSRGRAFDLGRGGRRTRDGAVQTREGARVAHSAAYARARHICSACTTLVYVYLEGQWKMG